MARFAAVAVFQRGLEMRSVLETLLVDVFVACHAGIGTNIVCRLRAGLGLALRLRWLSLILLLLTNTEHRQEQKQHDERQCWANSLSEPLFRLHDFLP